VDPDVARKASQGRTKAAIRETAEQTAARLEAVLEAAVDGVLSIDETGRVIAANPAAERIFGYSAEEILEHNVTLLMPSPFREEHHQYLANYFSTGERKIIGIGREVVGLRRDGSTFPMYLAVGEAFAGDQRLFTGFVRDLTERKRLEEQLIHSQRVEAVGELAGGIAHDFNNLLAVIQGSSEMALVRAAGDDRLRRSLERILQAAERGARLTGQLLAFSRRDVATPRVIDLNEEVEGMRELLGRLTSEEIAFKLRLTAAPSTVEIDPSHFDQILMNLVVNAGAAMPGGGQLKIETQTVWVNGDGKAGSLGLAPGRYVALVVEDTGTGIHPDHLPRLFEPFFTTKEAGRGTGLGLATVHAIVSRRGGAISVRSQLGEGTRFEIYLPHVARLPASRRPNVAAATPPASRSILLVEDDELVREMVSEVLEEDGHSVRVEASPADALLTSRSVDSIDLLLTDVVMPGMTGVELAERLHRTHPRLRVLFMSGYTDAHLEARGQPESGFDLIRKPFSPPALRARIAEILARD
jgi:PAS domain S-box-containing protein